MFFHLGDTYQDALKIRDDSGLSMRAVSGNMDAVRLGPETESFDLERYRILLVHGDRFAVNRDLMRLDLAAAETGADIVCFGHTHRPCCLSVNGRHFLNPGSFRGATGSYGILWLREHDVSFDIVKEPG